MPASSSLVFTDWNFSGDGLLNSMNSPRDISISRISSRFNCTIMSSIERL